MDKITMTIDPGWNTGIAVWDGDILDEVTTIIEPRCNKALDESVRLQWMWDEFHFISKRIKPDECVMEDAETWAGSARSAAAATRGNTFTLAKLIGGYGLMCGVKWSVISVREWKGQLTKTATAARVEMALGRKFKTDHETDAVGIGLHLWGTL